MRTWFAVVIIGLTMACSATARSAASGSVPCIAPQAVWNPASHKFIAAGGSCRLHNRVQPVTFYHEYNLWGQAGTPCITPGRKIAGKTITLKGLPHQLRARFGVALRTRGSIVKWGAWKTVAPQGIDYQCDQLSSTTLPSAASLCAWPDSNLLVPGGSTGSCGVPVRDSCAWVRPSTMELQEVVAGSVACSATPCVYNNPPGIQGIRWFTPTPITASTSLDCPDGTGVAVGLYSIQLGHYDDAGNLVVDCQAKPDGLAVTRFTIPSTWTSGVLLVDFRMYPYLVSGLSPRIFESQSSLFRLGDGLPTGCPLQLASINGH